MKFDLAKIQMFKFLYKMPIFGIFSEISRFPQEFLPGNLQFLAKIGILTCLVLGYGCGSTVEFIPDPGFVTENPYYTKTDYSEIEITNMKPEYAIRTEGQVLIRNFETPGEGEIFDVEELKKKMFEYKLDGVWIYKQEVVKIVPWIIQAKNTAGFPVSYLEAHKDMGKTIGMAYRIREPRKNKNEHQTPSRIP